MDREDAIKLKERLQSYLGAGELLDELCRALPSSVLGEMLLYIADMHDISLTDEQIEDDYE